MCPCWHGATSPASQILADKMKPWSLATACEESSWNHCTSTPHRSETIGIAERPVRRIKEGTSAVLLQFGLDEKRWADSMECYCYLPNVQDLLSDGKTPHQRRFREPFSWPKILFGSMIEYLAISAKVQSRLHQFAGKVLPRIFLGYVLHAGGIWKGDIMVADTEELQKFGRVRNSCSGTQCDRGPHAEKW